MDWEHLINTNPQKYNLILFSILGNIKEYSEVTYLTPDKDKITSNFALLPIIQFLSKRNFNIKELVLITTKGKTEKYFTKVKQLIQEYNTEIAVQQIVVPLDPDNLNGKQLLNTLVSKEHQILAQHKEELGIILDATHGAKFMLPAIIESIHFSNILYPNITGYSILNAPYNKKNPENIARIGILKNYRQINELVYAIHYFREYGEWTSVIRNIYQIFRRQNVAHLNKYSKDLERALDMNNIAYLPVTIYNWADLIRKNIEKIENDAYTIFLRMFLRDIQDFMQRRINLYKRDYILSQIKLIQYFSQKGNIYKSLIMVREISIDVLMYLTKIYNDKIKWDNSEINKEERLNAEAMLNYLIHAQYKRSTKDKQATQKGPVDPPKYLLELESQLCEIYCLDNRKLLRLIEEIHNYRNLLAHAGYAKGSQINEVNFEKVQRKILLLLEMYKDVVENLTLTMLFNN